MLLQIENRPNFQAYLSLNQLFFLLQKVLAMKKSQLQQQNLLDLNICRDEAIFFCYMAALGFSTIL
jgi:deoxyadenosine/deoxycytidine kinase